MRVNSFDRISQASSTTSSDFSKDSITKPKMEEGQEVLNKGVAEKKELTEPEKKSMPVSEKVVIDAIEKANKAIDGAKKEFRFSIHKKTHEIMIKVIDKDNGEVIREIPPEKVLDMVAKMWEMAGIVVDERR